MEELLKFIQDRLPFLINHINLFLFIGGIIEGLNTIILGGFLASFGQVKISIIFPLLLIAHIISGYMWYAVGYFGGAKSLDKWGHRNKISHNVINKVTDYFHRYSSRAIMFAKFTFGLEIATLIMAGSLKYNLKKFSKYNALGSIGWVTVTFFVGFFFGQSFKLFFTILKNLTIAIIFLGGAVALIYVLTIFLRRHYVGYLTWKEKIKGWGDRIRDGVDEFLNGTD